MKPRLENKVALITGGAQGIGGATAALFVEHGARVVVNVRERTAAAEAFVASLGGPDKVLLLAADVSQRSAVDAMVAQALSHFGRLDVLVNNAGINVFDDPLQLSDADWARCFSVDLEGAWHCARAVLPHMLGQGAGSVVNIASVHGHKIIPNAFPYPVAKHGLIGLTRALGIQYAAQGVRVNSVSPGLILTPLAESVFASLPDPQAERRRQAELLPCKRIGEPLEVAYTVLFLASDEARFINATDILIDGGRSQLYHE
ncbi:SDR family oxidoreductase [Verminephrobacter aporrectodeae]|uniref:SDR family oxidoreductase n=1 Tax=Verminephrobacter aporrectodeae TaxID=1110389 RepID=UPI00223759C6|nr:SDR family oxidoreductase [Verminephrobacter aporrectodeae]MCW5221439.1 SDR family oxidoreductase [Verminephrobacter aporrectodeae subsp. tuberculatae]MCW5257749.1 SDR family oxidoreductase [Verminephrobacter aporrectodeae subsp. tuberculatae]MCW5290730.1 SDR family oxidoreductase [Verminephrobacter aporrectodeae subsp. tuberculatae]MCW8175415.1 SDR family oxidoreductase [Verminephrobacter aporrectodeae subsp. tuberculatae]MCW8203360.1 SDR family oxidoreductase [Verminephrobacter aporrectod